MEEWSCQFIEALMEQLQLEGTTAFTISCCAHILTIISSRKIVQDLIDLFYDKCLEGTIQTSDLLSVIQLVSTKHFEMVLNKLESEYSSSVQKKNNLFSFIKDKFNEEKKQKSVTVLFSCLESAIKNAPLKELEFCADGITKRFLYPCLFNLKESNRSVEAALACVSTLSSTVRIILADNPKFSLAQRAELLHSTLAILQNDAMPLQVRQAAINTLTFIVHLPPNIGQLTRCSILVSLQHPGRDGGQPESRHQGGHQHPAGGLHQAGDPLQHPGGDLHLAGAQPAQQANLTEADRSVRVPQCGENLLRKPTSRSGGRGGDFLLLPADHRSSHSALQHRGVGG